jgi:hypothetical protein
MTKELICSLSWTKPRVLTGKLGRKGGEKQSESLISLKREGIVN